MDRHGNRSPEIECGLHGFFRHHVNGLPLLVVLTTFHQRKIERTIPLPDLCEVRAISAVGIEVDTVVVVGDHEGTPERPIPIPHAPSRKMTSRCCGQDGRSDHARSPQHPRPEAPRSRIMGSSRMIMPDISSSTAEWPNHVRRGADGGASSAAGSRRTTGRSPFGVRSGSGKRMALNNAGRSRAWTSIFVGT